MPPFLVCMHDVTPAYARETEALITDLMPLVGRRFSLGVVPDWHGTWALAAHPDFSAMAKEAAEELLLHGYFHQRRRGWGAISLLTAGCDEMNGLDAEETRETIERGQRMFADVFGVAARGFVAPGWQRGRVRPHGVAPGSIVRRGAGEHVAAGLGHVLGFFSLESSDGKRVPLATYTWDCGRWGWLGHLGHGAGRTLQSIGGRVPCLAIHPADVERGFWPTIRGLITQLLETGHEPATAASLLERTC